MNREPIYAALFDLVSRASGAVTVSRRLKHWSDVPASQQPALFQSRSIEVAIRQTGLPTKWQASVKLYIYAHNTGTDGPDTTLNAIIDAVETALAPYPGMKQTLGDLVHDCRIEGAVETDEGTLGDQGVMIIPILIIVSP